VSSFYLLKQRRFLPFFVVQFLGALNDNIFKNALLILVAFRAVSESESGLLVNLAAGLFILPFFIFSPVAGQIADRFDKARIMRTVKFAEIGIMSVGAVGFAFDLLPLLYATLFLMGTHSAFFGPAKYSIMPQQLRDHELMAGNALVEMGTFLAILLGTLAGGLLAGQHDALVISGGVLTVAVLGYLVARLIPSTEATAPGLKLDWNPMRQTVLLTRIVRRKEAVLNGIMGISWYWYYGATILAQLPSFTRHTLHGDESVVTVLLATFAVSIGFGSILCERLSRGEIELGLIPLGCIGMTAFVVDLFFIDYPVGAEALADARTFLLGPGASTNWHVIVDLALTGVFSSFFIVPLYALIQHRSDPDTRSRVIAANNVYNAVFMVASALITMVLFQVSHFNTLEVFLFTAILNAVVGFYIIALIPEFLMRFVIWMLANTIYRLRYTGRDQVPHQGAALLVANHISFIDWFVVTAACRRPVRFVVDHNFFKMPLLGLVFRAAKAIPIAPAKEDAALKERSFGRIAAELRDGNLVCVFPEGQISRDGAMTSFRPGVERILKETPVTVVPVALCGLWGSFFSRKSGKAMHAVPKPSRRVIDVHVGVPMASTATAVEMERTVAALLSGG